MKALSRKRVVLDIDGVIVKGGQLIDGAVVAIKDLTKHKIPYVFVTNGGGITEEAKAVELTKKIGMPISREQVVVCHTPMQKLVGRYRNDKVLVLGKPSCLDVAKAYGFINPVSINCLHKQYPHIYPCKQPVDSSRQGSTSSKHFSNDLTSLHEVSAAMVFHDPFDWGLEMQILSDVLMPFEGTVDESPALVRDAFPQISSQQLARGQPPRQYPRAQRIPLFASNADITYATEFPIARYTQGAFVECFRSLFEMQFGIPLEVRVGGSSHSIVSLFAEFLYYLLFLPLA